MQAADPIVWAGQIFSDMQRELVFMTKPKDPNVLVVHGVYAAHGSS